MSRLILFLLWPVVTAATTDEWIDVSPATKLGVPTVLRWRYVVTGTGAAASFEAALPRAHHHSGWVFVRVRATEAARIQKDAADNLTLVVEGIPLGAGQSRIVTVTAELKSKFPSLGSLAPVDEAPPPQNLNSVRPLAAKVRAAAPDRRLDVLWESLQILEPEGFRAYPRRVETTLALGRGDCTDLALVVVAVARAADMPARLVSGLRVNGSELVGPDAYHDWAEVHDGTRWRVLDLHARRLDPHHETLVPTHIDEVHTDVLTAFRYRPLTAGIEVQMLDGGGTARGGRR
jgi:hypothetical protein